MSKHVFTSKKAAELANITYKQLDTWIRAGIIEPEVFEGKGTGSTRLFSLNNIVALHIASMARAVGFSLEDMKGIIEHISKEMPININIGDKNDPWIVEQQMSFCTDNSEEYDEIFIMARGGEFYIIEGPDEVNDFVWRTGRFSGQGEGSPGLMINIGEVIREVMKRIKYHQEQESAAQMNRLIEEATTDDAKSENRNNINFGIGCQACGHSFTVNFIDVMEEGKLPECPECGVKVNRENVFWALKGNKKN